jgi:hypothetical protein
MNAKQRDFYTLVIEDIIETGKEFRCDFDTEETAIHYKYLLIRMFMKMGDKIGFYAQGKTLIIAPKDLNSYDMVMAKAFIARKEAE